MPRKTPEHSDHTPRRTSRLFLHRFWEAHQSAKRYQTRRSTLFNDADLLFVKSYEVLHDCYIKKVAGKGPLLTFAECQLYLDFLLQNKRGENQSFQDYADERNLDIKTLYSYLDGLENVGLIHREYCPDGSDHSITVVVHSPYNKEQLEKVYDKLLQRKNENWIAAKRAEAGRNSRKWLPHALPYGKLLQAFHGYESMAQKFEDIVADIVHQHIADDDYKDYELEVDVKEACQRLGVNLKWVEKWETHAHAIRRYLENISSALDVPPVNPTAPRLKHPRRKADAPIEPATTAPEPPTPEPPLVNEEQLAADAEMVAGWMRAGTLEGYIRAAMPNLSEEVFTRARGLL